MDTDNILDFRQQARKDYKDFKKLDKAEKRARKQKQDHLASIIPEYEQALRIYRSGD